MNIKLFRNVTKREREGQTEIGFVKYFRDLFVMIKNVINLLIFGRNFGLLTSPFQ